MEKKHVLLIFFIGFLSRLLFLSALPADVLVYPLSHVFFDKANGLRGLDECTRAAYPLLLSLIGVLTGNVISAGRIVNVVLGSTAPVIVYLIACRISNTHTAFYAGLFAGIHSLAFYWTPYLLPDQLFLTASTLAFYFALTRRVRAVFLSGLFSWISYQTIQAGLIIMFFLAVYILRRDGWRMLAVFSSVFIFALIITYPTHNAGYLGLQNIFLAKDVFTWSFTKERIDPSFPIFLLALAGLMVKRLRAVKFFSVGVLLLAPVVSSCDLGERAAYLPLIPYISILAAAAFTAMKKSSKTLAYVMLAVICFQMLHFGLNYWQSLEMIREYRELSLWVKDHIGDDAFILDCGSEWKPAFYISQFAVKRFIPCPGGDFEQISSRILELKPSYILVEADRLNYASDPREREGIESIYYNMLPENSSFRLSLVYMNNPETRKIQNHEIMAALYDGKPTRAASLIKKDVSSKKNILVKIYEIRYV